MTSKAPRLLIIVATRNRPVITALALTNLRACLSPDDSLVVYDDASTAYAPSDLLHYADDVISMPEHSGIERVRARNFRDMLSCWREFDLLYLTDNDVIHDPRFSVRLRQLYALGRTSDGHLPVSLYNSCLQAAPENTLSRSPQAGGVALRRIAPGASHLYDREMVERIVHGLDRTPNLETRYGYDYHLPALLNRPFLQSEQSFAEHFARDTWEGGIHAPYNGRGMQALADFERDRALNPTPYLQKIRPRVIEHILSGGATPRHHALALDTPESAHV